MLILGGIVMAIIAWWLGYHNGAVFVFIIGAVLQSIPARWTTGELVNKPRNATRDELNQELDEMIGIYTPARLREIQAEETRIKRETDETIEFWSDSVRGMRN